jgi:hypothetical protein
MIPLCASNKKLLERVLFYLTTNSSVSMANNDNVAYELLKLLPIS